MRRKAFRLKLSQPLPRESEGCNMYCSLLVPLDRTSFAEQALPLALGIARRANAGLELVEVHALYNLGDPTAGWLPFNPKRDTECMRKEQLYLEATAKWATYGSRV